MSFDAHVTLVFFKQCKRSNDVVIFDGHGSQEEISITLLTILLFFSQTQPSPLFIKKKNINFLNKLQMFITYDLWMISGDHRTVHMTKY